MQNINHGDENGIMKRSGKGYEHAVGSRERLVDLPTWVPQSRYTDQLEDCRIYQDSDIGHVCGLCGYDRAKVKTHTEIPTLSVQCKHCKAEIAQIDR